jgi:hypothetical protein
MADEKRTPGNESTKGRHVVDDSQSAYNEGQREPGGSGDRRLPRAVGIPLPWGGPTDDLHPIDQPAGDVTDPASDRTPHHHHDEKRDQKNLPRP